MLPDMRWSTYLVSFYGKFLETTVMIKRPKLIIISGHSDGKSATIERNVSFDRIMHDAINSGWHVNCKIVKRIFNDGSLAGVTYVNSDAGFIARIRCAYKTDLFTQEMRTLEGKSNAVNLRVNEPYWIS